MYLFLICSERGLRYFRDCIDPGNPVTVGWALKILFKKANLQCLISIRGRGATRAAAIEMTEVRRPPHGGLK